MKLFIIKDTRHPDYLLTKDCGEKEVEVDTGFYREYKKVMRMYGELQDKLEEIYND